jgi:hypothetical protein
LFGADDPDEFDLVLPEDAPFALSTEAAPAGAGAVAA